MRMISLLPSSLQLAPQPSGVELAPTLSVSFLANWGGSPGLIYADTHSGSH